MKREEISRHEKEEEQIRKDHSASEKKAALMEGFGARLDRIRVALLDTKDQLASDRLKRARPRSLELYQRLVRHPKFSCFDITTTPRARKVDYNFEVSIGGNSSTAREARLVLSDGQITATAVGVFVGLAESAAHNLDLLFIDDPTQNLDLPCKEAVAKLMVEMAGRKQIIVSTHDEDFVSYLKEYGFYKSRHAKGQLQETLPTHEVLAIDHKAAMLEVVEHCGQSGSGRIFQRLFAYLLGLVGYRTVTVNTIGVPDVVASDPSQEDEQVGFRLTVEESWRLIRHCRLAGDTELASRLLSQDRRLA